MPQNLPRILLVDDEPENLRALERTLRVRFDCVACTTPAEALDKVRRESFAVIISDQRMPGMVGTELLAQVASIKPLITRVILTAYTETREILDAINRAEIYRYVTKPWDNNELVSIIQQAAEHQRLLSENQALVGRLEGMNRELESLVAQRTAELQRANEKLSELAMTDPLTKVLNRRAVFGRFQEEIERGHRYKRAGVVVMIDVDHFKTFNDMEGHVFGDEALRKIAQIFTSNLRKTDVLGRYGGEEFIVIMPETKIENAMEICERLRGTVERTALQGHAGNAYLTVSVGLAAFPREGETAEELVKAADQALYRAKQNGRNRIELGVDAHASFLVR
jgi:diguanylate cyclase (GGDEF)-like protein